MIHRLHNMIGGPGISVGMPDGRYAMAVPEPFYGGLFDRIRDAWAIVRGDAFAIHWPSAGELECAMQGAPPPPLRPRKKLKW